MKAPLSLRVTLALAAALNLLGTLVFGSAALSHPLMALPLAPPPFYAAQIALTIALFGGVYAWLAGQAVINRPLLLVGALGKVGFFLLFVAFALAGDLGRAQVIQALPDLLFGGVFLGYLARSRG